ncbi:MAG: M24 family metallopeptidase, partial [Candidatus Nanosalina sp.]
MEFDFRNRMEQCREKMQEKDVDYIFLMPDANMFYVSGYEGEIHERHFFLVISQQDDFFFLPELYEEQVRGDTWIENFCTWADSENPAEELEKIIEKEDTEKILLSEDMQARFTLDLMKIFPDAEYSLAGEIFEELRIRKNTEEVERIRESSAVVDEVVEELREMGEEVVGKTENELAEIIENKMDEKGGKTPSFNTIASAGANGAKPHYEHGNRKIQEGDPVVLDFGCYMNHYPSDQTRTLVFEGEPSQKFQEVHETVREAQQKAFEKIEPGVEAREVDRAARKVIEDSGYGEEFIHRTGHGVGLEVHEPPYINQENTRKLEQGMIFSVEP